MAVYSIPDVERKMCVTYTPEQRAALRSIPFSAEVLKECVHTHILFPGFPVSLQNLRATHVKSFRTEKPGWYADQPFANVVHVELTWHLLRKAPVPESFDKTWDQQRELLLPDEEVPTVATIAFATLLHFRVHGQRLFEECYVRTADVIADGRRVDVGGFNLSGFGVSAYEVDERHLRLGLASERKLQPCPVNL